MTNWQSPPYTGPTRKSLQEKRRYQTDPAFCAKHLAASNKRVERQREEAKLRKELMTNPSPVLTRYLTMLIADLIDRVDKLENKEPAVNEALDKLKRDAEKYNAVKEKSRRYARRKRLDKEWVAHSNELNRIRRAKVREIVAKAKEAGLT